MNINNITNINDTIIRRKIIKPYMYPFDPFYVIDFKSFAIFPKYNGFGFVSESFALN